MPSRFAGFPLLALLLLPGPPPDSVPGQRRARAAVLPGSFKVLVVGPPR